jgi:chromosomal replication initiation ATPase DnaA
MNIDSKQRLNRLVIRIARVDGCPEEDTSVTRPDPDPDFKAVIDAVAKQYAVTADDILGTSRESRHDWARCVACFMAREAQGYTWAELAAFWRCDTGTIRLGVQLVQARMQIQPSIIEELESVLREIMRIEGWPEMFQLAAGKDVC